MAIEKDDSLPNLTVLRDIRVKGVARVKGTVISKKEFDNAGDWLNLCAMKPARLEQTDDKVGTKKKTAAVASALPGSE